MRSAGGGGQSCLSKSLLFSLPYVFREMRRKWRRGGGGPKSNLSRRIRPGIYLARGVLAANGAPGKALGPGRREAAAPEAWGQ